MTKAEVDEKIEQIIDFSECRQFIDTPVKRYSSGMYVKLAFAVAAHLDSEILVMDEVLAVGDMKFQQKCLGKMSEVSQSEGRTVLYVSHNMNTIRQLCSRCIVLDHGTVIFNGDVEEAIGIYMDQEKNESFISIDFSTVKRNKPEMGIKARLQYFEFLDKEEPVFSKGEPIRFRVKWSKPETQFEYRLLIPVRYKGQNIAGSCLSCILTQDDASYEMDVSALIPGEYSFILALFEINDYGTGALCDHSTIRIPFTIREDHKISFEWKRQWWGSVQFPELKMLED